MQAIVFKRSIRPGDAIEDPTLVMFSDGSHESFGTCAIARWTLSNGKYESHLIAVKHKKMRLLRRYLSCAWNWVEQCWEHKGLL